jgi:hypothetical protein
VEVPRGFFERTVQDLNDNIQGCIAQLVFNLDEVGISDWEDGDTKRVIALAAMLGQIRYDGVSRNVKHISVIACISAAGSSVLAYILTSQNSPAVQEHLNKQGVRFGTDFALKLNQKPYFNAGILLAYTRTILLSYIDTFRGRAVLAHEIALLLMAHCLADVSDDMIRILSEAMVRVVTFAPHTNQVFRVLDLIVFGVLERRPRYELSFDVDKATVKVIRKVHHDLRQTLI